MNNDKVTIMEGNTLLVLTRPLIMKLERQWAGFFMINRDYVEFSMVGARLGLCLSVKLFYDINEWFQMHAVKLPTNGNVSKSLQLSLIETFHHNNMNFIVHSFLSRTVSNWAVINHLYVVTSLANIGSASHM